MGGYYIEKKTKMSPVAVVYYPYTKSCFEIPLCKLTRISFDKVVLHFTRSLLQGMLALTCVMLRKPHTMLGVPTGPQFIAAKPKSRSIQKNLKLCMVKGQPNIPIILMT